VLVALTSATLDHKYSKKCFFEALQCQLIDPDKVFPACMLLHSHMTNCLHPDPAFMVSNNQSVGAPFYLASHFVITDRDLSRIRVVS
jgi:hypothetical protein